MVSLLLLATSVCNNIAIQKSRIPCMHACISSKNTMHLRMAIIELCVASNFAKLVPVAGRVVAGGLQLRKPCKKFSKKCTRLQ